MQGNGQHREIGFSDLFKIIFKNILAIVIVVILAAGIGAAIAYTQNKGINYYGATANYKISVSSVMAVDGEPQGEPSGSNYLYKEEHLSMLIDDLTSDTFIRDYIMKDLEGVPAYNPEATDQEADNFYAYLLSVKSCISYSYNYNRNPNAIAVTVKVLNNKDFAQKLLEQVKTAIPQYIVDHMIKPAPEDLTNSSGTVIIQRLYTTECVETSMSRIRLINGGQAQSAMLKYAVLAGFLAGIIACIVVIVIDYTDTRVRDPEEFASRSDLPLLGTVPKAPTPDKATMPKTEVRP